MKLTIISSLILRWFICVRVGDKKGSAKGQDTSCSSGCNQQDDCPCGLWKISIMRTLRPSVSMKNLFMHFRRTVIVSSSRRKLSRQGANRGYAVSQRRHQRTQRWSLLWNEGEEIIVVSQSSPAMILLQDDPVSA